MNKNAHPFKQLLVLIGSHIGMLVPLVLICVAVLAIVMTKGDGGDPQAMLSATGNSLSSGWMTAVLIVLQSVLLFMVPVIIVANCFYRDNKREFYCFDLSERKWLLALAGVIVYALLSPLVDWLGFWNNHWNVGETFSMMSKEYEEMIMGIVRKAASAGSVGLVIMVLVMAVVPAICEELFFRVGLQQLLGKWFKNDHVAVVVTAFVFSLMHLDMSGFLIRFVMGLVLGYVFLYSRSLVPNVMLHFLNNAVATISSYVAIRNRTPLAKLEEPWMVHWLPTVLCTIAALVLFWYCFVRKSNTIQQSEDMDS